MPVGIGFGILIAVLLAVAWSGIFRRMGWSPWWGLIMIVPGVNVISIVVTSVALFFQRWPIETKVMELEEELERLRKG